MTDIKVECLKYLQKSSDNLSEYKKRTTAKVNLLEKWQCLMEQSFETMKEDLKEIKTSLKDFINKSDDRFATKKEMSVNTQKIDKLEALVSKVLWTVAGTVFLAITSALLSLIIK